MSNIAIDNIKEFHTKMVEVYRPAYGTSEFFDYRDDIDNSVYFSTAVGEVRDAMLGYLFADDASRSISLSRLSVWWSLFLPMTLLCRNSTL